jgi:hypothetical protein
MKIINQTELYRKLLSDRDLEFEVLNNGNIIVHGAIDVKWFYENSEILSDGRRQILCSEIHEIILNNDEYTDMSAELDLIKKLTPVMRRVAHGIIKMADHQITFDTEFSLMAFTMKIPSGEQFVFEDDK